MAKREKKVAEKKTAPKTKQIKKKAPAKPKAKKVAAQKIAPKTPKKTKANQAAPIAIPQIPAPVLSKKTSVKVPVAPKLAKSTSKAPGNDVLYILMLDKSGSMYGQRWTELKQAVREFLQTLASDPA